MNFLAIYTGVFAILYILLFIIINIKIDYTEEDTFIWFNWFGKRKYLKL